MAEQLRIDKLSGRFTWMRGRQDQAGAEGVMSPRADEGSGRGDGGV